MVRLVVFLALIAGLATGLAWLADRPGLMRITWEDYEIETSVFAAIVLSGIAMALVLVGWSLFRQLWQSPATLNRFFMSRRQKHGLEAISSGMIAIGAGDRALAARYALQARKALPNEPLTHLLRAQAAHLAGDKITARRIFEAMLAAPDTEQLGLRGLFLEAQRENETEAAHQFAARAMRLNPKLSWPVEALLDIQCRAGDWAGALETLAVARAHHHLAKPVADRKRAVLLTGVAQGLEDSDPDRALTLALEAHTLAGDLVPAAAIAGRLLAARGNTPRATKVVQKTWLRAPHPDLATVYAFARLGDSPRDRLERVQQLTALSPHALESAIAEATAAIDAHAFDVARRALEPLFDGRATQRVCLLMARIEGEQHGDKGRVREWLARAVHALRDPVWTADGVVSDRWAPASPVTGVLDAFQWRVPMEKLDGAEVDQIARKFEELARIGPILDEVRLNEVGLNEVGLDEVRHDEVRGDETPQPLKPVVTPVTGGEVAPQIEADRPVRREEHISSEVTAPPPQPRKAEEAAPVAKSTPKSDAHRDAAAFTTAKHEGEPLVRSGDGKGGSGRPAPGSEWPRAHSATPLIPLRAPDDPGLDPDDQPDDQNDMARRDMRVVS